MTGNPETVIPKLQNIKKKDEMRMRIGRHGKRTVLSLCLLLLLCMMAGGCGREKKQAVSGIKIGVTLYDQYDTFITELMDEFTEYAAAKATETNIAINLEVLDARGDQTTQNEQVRTLIKKGCDVICVNLVDRTEPTTITDLAENKNVPIIFFNRELVAEDLERWNRLYYVGADAFLSGVIEGQIAAENFLADTRWDKNQDGICQYIILEGEPGHQDAIVRTDSSVNALVEAGVEVEKTGYAIANWNRAQAQTKTAALLENPDISIELILANNDDMALGAVDAMKAAKLPMEEWPMIVGIDGTAVGLDAVRKGELIGTVYNDKEGQADQMLDLAFTLATEGGPGDISFIDGKYIRLPYSKVTMENIEEYE